MHYSFRIEQDKDRLKILNADLMSGVKELDFKKVKKALKAGADPNYRDDTDGQSALYKAMSIFKSSFAKYQRDEKEHYRFDTSSKIVQNLFKSGANIRQENSPSLHSKNVDSPLGLLYGYIVGGNTLKSSCFDEIFKRIEPSNPRSLDLYAVNPNDSIPIGYRRVDDNLPVMAVKLGVPNIGSPFNYQSNEYSANPNSFKINEAPLCFQAKQLFGRAGGLSGQDSLELFKKSLENYFLQMDPNDPCMNTINLIHKQLPKRASDFYKDNEEKKQVEVTEDLSKKLKNDELVVIPTGWEEHSITLAIWHGYLVVSNKGEEGSIIGTCQIYPLKNKLLSPQDLQGILKGSKAVVIKNILNLVIQDQVINLPASFQKYGTCGFSNKKNIVRRIYFLENLGSKKWTELDQNEKEALIEKTQKQYKQYQQYDRNSYLNALSMLANLAQELGKKEDVKMFLTELAFYMIWHCDDLKEFQSYNNIIEPLTKENKLTLMELICHPDRKLSISELKNTAELTWAEQIKNEIYLTALKLKIHDKTSLERSKNIVEHLEFIASQFPNLDLTDTINYHLFDAILCLDEKTTLRILSLPTFSKKKFDDTYPFSLISYALMTRNLSLIEKVLSFCKPTEINSLQNDGSTPLLQAIKGNYGNEIIAFLIKKGASINLADENGKTPFMAAIERKDPDFLELLVNSVTVQKLDEDQCSEALFALTESKSHLTLVKQLIDSNIDLNKQKDNLTLIHQVVVDNNQEMLKILLEQPNIDINIQNQFGVSPILMSVNNDNKDMFELLLQHGAKIDIHNTKVSDFLERHNISKSIILA